MVGALLGVSQEEGPQEVALEVGTNQEVAFLVEEAQKSFRDETTGLGAEGGGGASANS